MFADVAIGQMVEVAEKNGYILMVTADHGKFPPIRSPIFARSCQNLNLHAPNNTRKNCDERF